MENGSCVPRTTDGKSWVKAYMHPPSSDTAVAGVPDLSVQSSITLKWKNERNIVAPPGVGTGTWSVLIMSIPNPQVPTMTFKWLGDAPATATGADVLVESMVNTNFDFGTDAVNWNAASARFRPYCSSSTTYFDASDLYNQGKTWICQSSVADYDTLPNGTTTGLQTREEYNIGTYPTVPSQIVQISEKSYSGHAKDGGFVVMGFSNPVLNYESASSEVQTFIGKILTSAGSYGNFAQYIGYPDIPSGQKVAPTYDNFTWGFQLYQGLLAQATIEVKRVHGYEILPNAGSTWAPFVTPGSLPDSAALECAALERHKMLDGMPSSSNDLGSFWNAAKSLSPILSSVWKVAKTPLKMGLGTLPAGGLLNQIVDGVESLAMANSRTKKAKSAPQPKGKKLKAPKPGVLEKAQSGSPLSKSQKKRLRQQKASLMRGISID